jgi:UDP-hydrolysing UDP-N-acetyl-D-glucosamine 2-epimerase
MMSPDDRGAVRGIAVVTGSRAEYGLLKSVLAGITQSADLTLRLLVCGMHLEPAFGRTVEAIEIDGFSISDRIETWSGADTPEAIAASISHGIAGFAKAFAKERPHLLLLLGDRYDMFAAAIAALPFALPIAHIHGGELTEGAIDEAMRHSLTKMSHLHFVANEVYRDRVIQMGEQPQRVFISGGPAIDVIHSTRPTPRTELEQRVGITLEPAPMLVTFHPVTLEYGAAATQSRALMAALATVERPILFTYPSADTAASAIIAAINEFVAQRANARVVKSLGTADYLGMMAISAAMVGNSSSGIVEAPSFGLPVVNIGNRQRGRLRAANVIDCEAESGAIAAAIERAVNLDFRASLKGLVNPYGDGHAAERIVRVLREVPLDANLVEKRFYDLPDLAGLLRCSRMMQG